MRGPMIGLIGKSALQVGLVVALMLASVNAQEKPGKDPKAQTLTASQKLKLRELDAESKTKAAELLLGLTDTAKKFNKILLSDAPDEELDQKLGRQMAAMMAEAYPITGSTDKEHSQHA